MFKSRELLHEPDLTINAFQTYPLEGLKEAAWRNYFHSYNISINANTMEEVRSRIEDELFLPIDETTPPRGDAGDGD
ncbi:hypothetical protein [Coleofasciculus sp. E1-EBD-02]|uniref:hypothetical protein n=1 Tax=Coleofasciculus sp. E1-EBD-02 TaxID=3068481 RepID=UPI0032F85015